VRAERHVPQLHGRTRARCFEDIDYKHRRGLERSLMISLSTGDWIRSRHNLHLTGPTGTGKSWLACALGHQACRQGLSVQWPGCSTACALLAVTGPSSGALPKSPKPIS